MREYDCTAAIQAVTETEWNAVLDMYTNWKELRFDDAPQPKALIIKSVCDFADNEKSDKYQKFAAYTSCEFAKLMYEKYLPL